MTTATTNMETTLLDAHYQGDPVARFAWLGWCEDNGVKLTEAGITGVWRGTLAEWLDVGPSLVRRFALERVELDREPQYFSHPRDQFYAKWAWYECHSLSLKDPFTFLVLRTGPGRNLPGEWFQETTRKWNRWRTYPTRQDAIDDASRRAVRWARGQGQGEEVGRGPCKVS